MAASSPNSRASSLPGVAAAALLAMALALPAARGAAAAPAVAPAKPGKGGGDITIDCAGGLDVELSTNNVYCRRARIAQGSMSVSADQGQATQESIKNFENSLWQFHNNVKVTTEDAQLLANDAQVHFVKNLLAKAVARGKPAEFQGHDEKTGKSAHGHAENIDYDAAKGLLVLSKNAWVTDGQYELSGESFKYDMRAQRIIADPGEQDSQRVHIIVTPPPSKP
jgi:lipopolysaccharide transport protein LptA